MSGNRLFALYEKVNVDMGEKAGLDVSGFSHMKFDDLDPLLAAPARVAILATLADGRPWLFSDLRTETRLADGNLHVQTRKLKEAGYISGEKVASGGRRVTRFRLAEPGRQALSAYVHRLERALKQASTTDTLGSIKAAVPRDDDSRVW